MRPHLRASCAVWCILLTFQPSAIAGQARGGGGSSTARPVSSSVYASWSSFWGVDGSAATLLVLWRGAPGWFAKGAQGGSGGSSGGIGYQQISAGGLTLTVEVDYNRKVVKLLEQELSLTGTNVILVDLSEDKKSPIIVGTRWVEPAPPSELDAIEAMIKQSSELFEFLRCDVPPPQPPGIDPAVAQALQQMVSTAIVARCDRMRP
jgi:hypothetical protein